MYSPDNGVTRNFMPHLWMFLLKSITPAKHKVFLIDGNAQPMNESDLSNFVKEKNPVEITDGTLRLKIYEGSIRFSKKNTGGI